MTRRPDRRPDLSVVLVTPDSIASIRRTVRHLRAQSAADRIELIVVAPSPEVLRGHESECEGFHELRVVAVGTLLSRGRAAARGVHAARAPLVAFTENHSFPDPGWAEALIRAHDGPWACVGPAVGNANPRTLTSRANFALSYGQWAGPAPAGERALLPFHNSAYKKRCLDRYGAQLETWLEAEGELQADLVRAGERLYLQPAARTMHVNEADPAVSVRLLYSIGRTFGAGRSRNWPVARRAAYVVGAPLIPLMNLPRVLREGLRIEGRVRFVALLPSLLLHLAAQSVGEAVGYLAGGGGARQFVNHHEFLSEGRDVGRGALPE